MKPLWLVLILALCMPGCSMLTKSGRQERAYSKYVRKMSNAREKQRIREIRQRAAVPKLRPLEPSPPEEHIQVSESQ